MIVLGSAPVRTRRRAPWGKYKREHNATYVPLVQANYLHRVSFFLAEIRRGELFNRALPVLRQRFREHLQGSVSSMCPLSEGVRK